MISLMYDEEVKTSELREVVIGAIVGRREDEDAIEMIRHLCLALRHLEYLEAEAIGDYTADDMQERHVLSEVEALRIWRRGYERENPGQMEGENLGAAFYPECLPDLPSMDRKTLGYVARVCGAKDKARSDCMREMMRKKING